MPILDKLNKKLDEAGVEEHGRTIEEAVDLLPAMGGSGGLNLEQIGTTHEVGWFNKGQGTFSITYYRVGGEGSNLFAIYYDGNGSPYTNTDTSQHMVIDESPNIKKFPIGKASADNFLFPITNYSDTHLGDAYTVLYKPNMMYLKPATAWNNIVNFSGWCFVIAELADNIT